MPSPDKRNVSLCLYHKDPQWDFITFQELRKIFAAPAFVLKASWLHPQHRWKPPQRCDLFTSPGYSNISMEQVAGLVRTGTEIPAAGDKTVLYPTAHAEGVCHSPEGLPKTVQPSHTDPTQEKMAEYQSRGNSYLQMLSGSLVCFKQAGFGEHSCFVFPIPEEDLVGCPEVQTLQVPARSSGSPQFCPPLRISEAELRKTGLCQTRETCAHLDGRLTLTPIKRKEVPMFPRWMSSNYWRHSQDSPVRLWQERLLP